MGLLKIDSSCIETDVIQWCNKCILPRDKWAEALSKYTGSTSHIDIQKWLAFVKYTSANPYTKSFSIENLLDINFDLAYHKNELSAIVDGLIKRGQYKKYVGVWNWIPEIQEILLTKTWNVPRTSKKLQFKPAPNTRRSQRLTGINSRDISWYTQAVESLRMPDYQIGVRASTINTISGSLIGMLDSSSLGRFVEDSDSVTITEQNVPVAPIVEAPQPPQQITDYWHTSMRSRRTNIEPF